MLWRDRTLADARDDMAVAATLKAAGFKNANRSDIEIPDLRKVRREFDDRLAQPLDIEVQRARVLREVRAS